MHDDVIKWKHFPRNWPFVREIHRSPVNFPHKGQWRGALMFSLIYARINDWVNNREAGDLRRQHGHYDVIVMAYKDTHAQNSFTVSLTGCLKKKWTRFVQHIHFRFHISKLPNMLDCKIWFAKFPNDFRRYSPILLKYTPCLRIKYMEPSWHGNSSCFITATS